MNLMITKSEEMDFPNYETLLYSNCKAKLTEFNRFGSLLAIGCKYGLVLVMDFIAKEIVRIFDVFGNTDLKFNSDITNFVPYSNEEYSQIFDLFVHENVAVVKPMPKPTSPHSKDREQVNISEICWSYDSRYLLVSYQGINSVVLWDVDRCEKVHEVSLKDPGFARAQLHPFDPLKAVISSSAPYILNMKTREVTKFLVPTEEEEKMELGEVRPRPTEEESWIANLCCFSGGQYYLLTNTKTSMILLLQDRKCAMEDVRPLEEELKIRFEEII